MVRANISEMGTADLDQPEPVFGAPRREQTQVGRVADPGVAGLPGQEPGDRISFSNVERFFVTDNAGTKVAHRLQTVVTGRTYSGRVERLRPILGPCFRAVT